LLCEYPPLEQLCAWGILRARRGWSPIRLKIYDEGTLCGGAQMLEKSFRSGIRVGYIHNGLIPDHSSEGIASFMVEQIVALCRSRRLTYLVVRLAPEAGQWVDVLRGRGFQVKPDAVPPFVQMRDTVRIDLRNDEETLFHAFRSTTRNRVRRAVKAHLAVRDGSREDLPVFESLVRDLCARRGVKPNIPMGDALGELWEGLHRRHLVRMTLVEAGGTPTSAMIVVYLGNLARAWATGWDGRNGGSCPNESIFWESIRRAREAGCTWFDMGGIGKEASAATPEGDGITHFKMGFGGAVIQAPPELYFAPNGLYRAVIQSCRRSRLVSGFASWFSHKLD
jgi:peptidoglycan pentaglycine glycine transferase (the first glycine)